MPTISVRWSKTSAEMQHKDLTESLTAGESVTREGVLTTDHAASSYGLPVLVVDGVALGSAEAPEGELHAYGWTGRDDGTPLQPSADQQLAEAARRAGYRVVGI